MNWTSIIESLGVSTVIISCITYLAKMYFDKYFNSKVEMAKSKIELEAYKQKTSFTKFHEKRFLIIEEFHLESHDLFDEINLYFDFIGMGNTSEIKRDRNIKIQISISEYINSYKRKKLYLGKEVSTIIDGFLLKINRLVREGGTNDIYLLGGDLDWKAKAASKLQEIVDITRDEIPKVLISLETEFLNNLEP